MADLIELDVVVKQKGLKESLSTVERLERQLKNAAKAVDQNVISQQRYNKILLSAKREYQALGVSSQKATADVRNFANAQREVAKNVGMATVAIKGNAQAQMAATKGSNQFGVVTQQAGYQVSDFIVQIQSGTNAFVAFGQQASQLVGVLPLIASPLGLTAGAAVALSAGLGIAIPLVTAIGAAFMRSSKAADKAEEKISGLARTLKNYKQEQRALAQSVTVDQLALIDRIEAIKELQQEYLEVLKNTGGGDRSGKNRAEAEATIKILNDLLLKTTGQQKDLQQLINDEYTKRVKSMERANMLASIENKFGQDHIKYRNEARRQAEIELEAEIKASGVSDHIADRLRDRLKNEYDIIDAKVEQDKLDQAAEGRQEAIVNSLKSGLAIYEQMVSENKKIQDAAEKIKDTHNDELRDLSKKIALVRIETKFGKESVIYQQAASDAERDAYKQSRMSQGIKGKLLAIEMDLYDNLQKQKKELKDVNEEERQRLLLVKEQLKFYERQAERQMILNQSPIFMNMESIDEAVKIYQDGLKEADRAQKEVEASAEKLKEELEGPLVSAIGSVSDAFGDFIARGLQDFKGFVSQILGSFQNMIAQMIATAARNRIMISLGMGGAGTVAGTTSAFAGPIGSFLGTTGAAGVAGTGLMGGVGSVFGSGGIGLSGSFSALGSILGGGSLGGGFALGAAIPAIAAVVAVVGLFTKKVKELDSGLRVTIDGTDTLVETFSLLEKSRLFGLIKSKSTEFQAAGADIADPVTEAVSNIQSEILKAADAFGIGAGLFENFTYKFQVSLKGLTEDEKMQAINQELAKMGDEFASLSGHFSDMNSLLAAANERYNLQIRLLETIGKQEEALSMRRESELSSVHELNRELLQAIYAVEDAQRAVDIAFSNLASVIDREKRTLEQGYADSVDVLKAGFDNLIDGIEARLEAAQRAASISQGVYSALESALRGRGFVSESQFSMARETATSYLRELRGAGRIEDEQALEDALKIVAEPSQDLYEDFVSYQRDFQKQTNVIRDLEAKTKLQLSTDEKTLLAIQEEKDAAQIRHEESLSKLDDNLQSELLALDKQYNELVGIKEVNLTMVEAIKAVENAIKDLELKQGAAAKIGGVGGGGVGGVKADFGGNIDLLDKYDAGKDFTRDGKTYDFIKLSGANQLLDAAQQLGIQTAGQTGAQIQQAISNAGNLAVNLDNATRNQQFALGGYFSGGVRMVGERGPELEMTGPSRIMSNNDTRKMLQNPDLVEAVKDMRQEIAELRNEQRQLGINNNKYTKRTYDLYRQWDTEGLPAERT